MNPMSKGPQGPRRSPQQARSAQKQRDIMQQIRDEEMSRRMREGYEKAMGMKEGGMPDLTGDGKVTRADVLKGRGVFKHGGKVKKYAKGGSVGSASKRADGCAMKGKTRGKFV